MPWIVIFNKTQKKVANICLHFIQYGLISIALIYVIHI